MRICPLKSNFCQFSHTESSVASSPLHMLIFPYFSVFYRTHWFAHKRQKRLNNRSLFLLPPFARLPLQYSDRLCCFCPLFIFKGAKFLVRPIGLYPGSSCLCRKIVRASRLRCALRYRCDDVTVLVRITYNEGCNVIMTVTGSASQLRGSEFL